MLRSLSFRRATVLCAIAAVALAVAGCSDIFGGGEPVPVEEVVMVDDDGSSFVLAGSSGVARFHMAIEQGVTQHVTFRFNNRNGVPATDPEAYSVSIYGINNPALFSWRAEGARSGFFTAVASGFTTFRLQVSRGDSVVYTSARIGVDIYTRTPPAS